MMDFHILGLSVCFGQRKTITSIHKARLWIMRDDDKKKYKNI